MEIFLSANEGQNQRAIIREEDGDPSRYACTRGSRLERDLPSNRLRA